MGNFERILKLIYPPLCLSCGEPTDSEQSLCHACWPEAHFISGLICDSCGISIGGLDSENDVYCDSCFKAPNAWRKGRAVALYQGPVRQIVLALKHGDRLDVAKFAGAWMAKAAEELVIDDTVVVPVPLHWQRMLKRKFNQAGLLAKEIAKQRQLKYAPLTLKRIIATKMQKGMTREQRFKNQQAAIIVPERNSLALKGKNILVVDDVMTTGATLAACAEACYGAGAKTVNVIVLARVAKFD